MEPKVARIFRPARSAMQAGRGNTKHWVLEFEPDPSRKADPLMGWTGVADTHGQIKLRFDTKQEAVNYAKARGIPHQVIEPEEPKRIAKAYADNFRTDRRRPWTH